MSTSKDSSKKSKESWIEKVGKDGLAGYARMLQARHEKEKRQSAEELWQNLKSKQQLLDRLYEIRRKK